MIKSSLELSPNSRFLATHRTPRTKARPSLWARPTVTGDSSTIIINLHVVAPASAVRRARAG